jgi:hypothetical protein
MLAALAWTAGSWRHSLEGESASDPFSPAVVVCTRDEVLDEVWNESKGIGVSNTVGDGVKPSRIDGVDSIVVILEGVGVE